MGLNQLHFNTMKKNLLMAALLSTAAAAIFAQAPAVEAPMEAASGPMHMHKKPDHRKPMHVESTQPKTHKHHAKKAAAPASQASAAQ